MPFALVCTRCSQPLSLIENLTNRSRQRCNECERRLQAFQEDTLAWIEQAFQESTGVTAEIGQEIYLQIAVLHVPPEFEEPIASRLGYLRNLTRIRQGDFPHVRTDIHLDTDEYAHFEIPATYFKPGTRPKGNAGRLVGTNKRAYFIADSGRGSATLSWGSVSQTRKKTLEVPGDGYTTSYQVVSILVSKGQGGGDYYVPDPFYVKTIIDALVKRWRRYLVEKYTTDGAVPDYVKAQVYQRDEGKCVACGFQDPYIEYDHKIPRSKGGPNTVENIQLLCRGCNREKSDKMDFSPL